MKKSIKLVENLINQGFKNPIKLKKKLENIYTDIYEGNERLAKEKTLKVIKEYIKFKHWK